MKVLWERRPVPDNYVGPLFLSQLKHNHNVVGYNPQTLAGDAGVLLISLAAAMNFVLTFAAIYSRGLDPRPERCIELDARPREHARERIKADRPGRHDFRRVGIAHCPLHTRRCSGLKPIR